MRFFRKSSGSWFLKMDGKSTSTSSPTSRINFDIALNHAMKMYNINYANNIKMGTKQMFRKFCEAVLYSTGRVWPQHVLNELINRELITNQLWATTGPVRNNSIIIEEFIWHMTINDETMAALTTKYRHGGEKWSSIESKINILFRVVFRNCLVSDDF